MESVKVSKRVFYTIFTLLILVACKIFESVSQDETSILPTLPASVNSPGPTSISPKVPTSTIDTSQISKTHVIWDDDGSPDGVIALLYFLKSPDVIVDAFTVSCGEAHTEVFASNLSRMLVRLDLQDIPIGAGRDIPLEGENAFPDPWRSATDEFWGINLPGVDDYIYTSSAVEIIIGVLEESPWPVTVFVSGTHTNLAAALRLKPDIGKKIAAVQVMGGAFYVPGNIESDWPEIHNKTAEWNIWVDPVAASEVFSSNLSIHVTPLDATNQVIWTSHDADVWEASGTPEGVLAAEILRWMLDSWYPEGVYAWDLVAAVNVTHPDFCEQEQIHVDIITAPGDEEGRTIVVNDKPSNATVCLTPQVDEIKNLVAHVLSLP